MSDTPKSTVQVRVPVEARGRLDEAGFAAGAVLDAVSRLPPGVVSRLMAGDTTQDVSTSQPATPAVSRPAVSQPEVKRGPTQAEARAAASRNAVRVATTAALCVGVASGVLSVRATAAFAVSQGVVEDGWTKWLFPVAIEGSMVAASVVLWSRHGNRLLAWAMMFGSTGLAIAANIAHNPDATLAGQWFAAVPPVAAFVMVEIVASLRDRSHPVPKVANARVRLAGSLTAWRSSRTRPGNALAPVLNIRGLVGRRTAETTR